MSDEILKEILKEFKSLNKGLSKDINTIEEQLSKIITQLNNIDRNTKS